MAVKPVNERQLEILRWIADGCPDGVMLGETYKHSAAALKSRHLVKISKRDGWHAEVTSEGRYFLEHGAYPGEAPIITDQSPRRVKSRSAAAKKTHREAAPMAVEPEHDERHEDTLVRVPGTLRNPHPAVAALRDEPHRLALTPAVKGRALRILQALVNESEARGWSAREVKSQRNEYGYRRFDSKDHLVIETGEATVSVRVFQQSDRSPHLPTTEELDRQKRWGTRPPKYDHIPNDSLRIEIDSRWDGQQHSWSEGKRGPLEDKLTAIIEEIERRHAYAQERRIEQQRADEQREHRRLEAVERAKMLLRETHRAKILAEQVSSWRYTTQLREYVETMECSAAALEGVEREAALAWIGWARKECDRVDPLQKPIQVPEDPEATPEALRPFLGGWSPYGPDRH